MRAKVTGMAAAAAAAAVSFKGIVRRLPRCARNDPKRDTSPRPHLPPHTRPAYQSTPLGKFFPLDPCGNRIHLIQSNDHMIKRSYNGQPAHS